MEGDEMEMSEEELQKWIREEVNKSKLISPEVLEKCTMLQSLLERREKQAAHLLKLCESVAACEALVKKQFSLLGREYRDTLSDDDDEDITDCGYTPTSPCDVVHTETQHHHSPATNRLSSLLQKPHDSEHQNSNNGKSCSVSLVKKPVVVLFRLPECKISALRPSIPQKHCSKNQSLSNSDSEMQGEPEDDSRDSEYCISSFRTGSKTRRKIHQKKNKKPKIGATPQASSNTKAKSNAMKTSTPQASSNTDTKNSTEKPSSPKASLDSSVKSSGAKTSTPEAKRNASAKRKETKTLTAPKNTTLTGEPPVCISALCQSNETTKKTPSSMPLGDVTVNMNVLARRREMIWQRGQIQEILEKEDGRVKYKVNFVEKGKSLVSGHHIAFDHMPKVDHLFVGARVVVKLPDDQPHFCPGILAEVPSRKNRMRFLVFTDDQKPIYVGLPLLHLVCRPLADPLDDILDTNHKDFLKDYLKMWPYPPQTQYKIGQIINAELNGVLEKCKVHAVDCSIIEVVFQKDQHKEWLYRGSLRLEHMINMRENSEARKNSLASTASVSR